MNATISNERDETIKTIRTALKARTGLNWSVTGGRGTAWGWIKISAPPARLSEFGYLTPEDSATLAKALGLDRIHQQGVDIAASTDYRREYIARAKGETPAKIAQPYWD